jgi:hypothetical protein
LVGAIKEVISEESPILNKPEFVFELTREAALKNYLVLKKYNLHLGKALEAQKTHLSRMAPSSAPPPNSRKYSKTTHTGNTSK